MIYRSSAAVLAHSFLHERRRDSHMWETEKANMSSGQKTYDKFAATKYSFAQSQMRWWSNGGSEKKISKIEMNLSIEMKNSFENNCASITCMRKAQTAVVSIIY